MFRLTDTIFFIVMLSGKKDPAKVRRRRKKGDGTEGEQMDEDVEEVDAESSKTENVRFI